MKQCSQDEKAKNSARSNSETSVGTNFIRGQQRTLSVYSCVIQKLKACYMNPDIKILRPSFFAQDVQRR